MFVYENQVRQNGAFTKCSKKHIYKNEYTMKIGQDSWDMCGSGYIYLGLWLSWPRPAYKMFKEASFQLRAF